MLSKASPPVITFNSPAKDYETFSENDPIDLVVSIGTRSNNLYCSYTIAGCNERSCEDALLDAMPERRTSGSINGMLLNRARYSPGYYMVVVWARGDSADQSEASRIFRVTGSGDKAYVNIDLNKDENAKDYRTLTSRPGEPLGVDAYYHLREPASYRCMLAADEPGGAIVYDKTFEASEEDQNSIRCDFGNAPDTGRYVGNVYVVDQQGNSVDTSFDLIVLSPLPAITTCDVSFPQGIHNNKTLDARGMNVEMTVTGQPGVKSHIAVTGDHWYWGIAKSQGVFAGENYSLKRGTESFQYQLAKSLSPGMYYIYCVADSLEGDTYVSQIGAVFEVVDVAATAAAGRAAARDCEYCTDVASGGGGKLAFTGGSVDVGRIASLALLAAGIGCLLLAWRVHASRPKGEVL